MITAIMIDQREPDWVKQIRCKDAPTVVTLLDAGDIWAVTEDGATLMIERKTPDDFLNTLKEERLFPQLAKLAEYRIHGQAAYPFTHWPYLMITGDMRMGAGGKVHTERGQTQWDWKSVQGALLTIQEMGVFVTYCAGDSDLEAAIIRLGDRKRDPNLKILPPRPPQLLGVQAAILCSLPGIGIEKAQKLLTECETPAWALTALSERDKRVRLALGLKDGEFIHVYGKETNNE